MSSSGVFESNSPFISDRYFVTVTAGVNLTPSTAVYVSGANTVSPTSADTQVLLGVTLTSAPANSQVNVITRGRVRAVAGGAISAGDLIGAGAGGTVVSFGQNITSATAAGQYPRGVALTSATGSGSNVVVLLW